VPNQIGVVILTLAAGGRGATPPVVAPADSPTASARPAVPAPPQGITCRPGYTLTVAVDDLARARFLEVDPDGVLYVSRPEVPPGPGERRSRGGDITRLEDADGDGFYERRTTFVQGPTSLHGLCLAPDESGAMWLWYSTSGSIRKARDTSGDGVADENIAVIPDGMLPSGGVHWWRSLLVAHGTIYTSIGDSGNITDETASERQKIWTFDLSGKNKKPFAGGIRNTEKLRLRPGTREVWGLDHGSDWFGRTLDEDPANPAKGQPITDRYPPEEINHYEEGKFYGHPFIAGEVIPRFEFLDKSDLIELAARNTAPRLSMPAHWAGNGFTFLDPQVVKTSAGKPGAMPSDHAGDMIACYHGSWNRTQPAGYCVVRVIFDPIEQRPIGYVTLVDGLRRGPGDRATPVIRPVDAVQVPDGSVLFSCDMTGRVYRIRTTTAR